MEYSGVELTSQGSQAMRRIKEDAGRVLEQEFSPYIFSDAEVMAFLSLAEWERREFSHAIPEEQTGLLHMRDAGVVSLH